MKDSDLMEFIDGQSAATRTVVLAVRDLVRHAAPHVVESLLWGGLSYHRPTVGGRVKGAVCQITVKRDQVRLEFIHGVRLSDRLGLLQGNRISKRFVPIESVADAALPGIAALIHEAAELDPSEWSGEGALR